MILYLVPNSLGNKFFVFAKNLKGVSPHHEPTDELPLKLMALTIGWTYISKFIRKRIKNNKVY